MQLAKDHLKSFVDRIERLHEERKALADDVRDIYAEAKANGFDAKALKIVVQRRAQGADAVAEMDAIIQTYEAALGTPVATRAPAREPVKPSAVAAARADVFKRVGEIDTDIPPELRVGSPENKWLRGEGKPQ